MKICEQVNENLRTRLGEFAYFYYLSLYLKSQ
jgi:hypothetical protein